MSVAGFYDGLAPDYHWLIADWDALIARQVTVLSEAIEARWPGARTILDLACGIGTQALGLAARGYAVTGSDISSVAVERARREADARGLALALSVADMRRASDHHRGEFDVVIACENAIPHLETEAELDLAFAQMRACVRPGGGCIVSAQDYAALLAGRDLSKPIVRRHGVHDLDDGRRVQPVQIWRFDPVEDRAPAYELEVTMTVEGEGQPSEARTWTTRYRAWSLDALAERMAAAGFAAVERPRTALAQSLIVGRRPPVP